MEKDDSDGLDLDQECAGTLTPYEQLLEAIGGLMAHDMDSLELDETGPRALSDKERNYLKGRVSGLNQCYDMLESRQREIDLKIVPGSEAERIRNLEAEVERLERADYIRLISIET